MTENLSNLLDRHPELFAKKRPKVFRGTKPNNTKGQKAEIVPDKMSISQQWNQDQG